MNIRQLTIISLLIALEIILTRFLSIQTLIVRISFGFVAIFIVAYLYGPLWGGTMAAISDVLGMMIFPKGHYFPGFTLTAFITGYLFGVFFHQKFLNILYLFFSMIFINIIIILLNTCWLSFLIGKSFIFILPIKIIQLIFMLPVQLIIIIFILKNTYFNKIFLTIKKLPS